MKKRRKFSSHFTDNLPQLCPFLLEVLINDWHSFYRSSFFFFINIFFWGHSGVTLWCDFQCLTSDSSHSFSLCSLKILQWFVRRPDEDGLSASLLKQWSYMKDYIKDVSLPPTFLIVHFVVCFSRWMHACICTIWFLFPLHSRRIWLSHFVKQFSLNVFWLSFFSANLIHILCSFIAFCSCNTYDHKCLFFSVI